MNEFTKKLRLLWFDNQSPTLRSIARDTHGRVSHTCVGTALSGVVLPRWNTCVAIIEALGGDPAQYRMAWEQADEASRREVAS